MKITVTEINTVNSLTQVKTNNKCCSQIEAKQHTLPHIGIVVQQQSSLKCCTEGIRQQYKISVEYRRF